MLRIEKAEFNLVYGKELVLALAVKRLEEDELIVLSIDEATFLMQQVKAKTAKQLVGTDIQSVKGFLDRS